MKARYTTIKWENEAQTVASFFFKPDKPYYFTAGQYADFSVPSATSDPRGLARTMTIMTSPSEKQIGFTSRMSGAQSNYKSSLLRLKPGDVISVTEPMGDLVLPLDESIPLVFIAGGVAIASYISMIRWLTEQNDKRSITLLYAVRNRNDIIFQHELDAYASIGELRKILYTTDTKLSADDWDGDYKQARLTSRDVIQYLPPDGQVYLSGTERMVEQLRRELEHDHGVEHYRIVFDYYEGYQEL